jgi:tetratricopeptide (TPR) repeat protein
LEREGPRASLLVLERLKAGSIPSPQLKSRFVLEMVLILHNMGKFRDAVEVLDLIQGEFIAPRDNYRAIAYRAMNMDDTEGASADERLSLATVERAYRDGCVDEALMMRALRARTMSSQGDPVGALKDAAAGLRIAHKSGLHLRENFFYRMVATTYLELNDARRARASQQRALQVAGTVGLKYLVGTSWARLSDNERILGRFDNALHYGKRALSLMGADAPARDLGQARWALFGAAVFLRVASEFEQVGDQVMNAELANDRAHYYLWRGRDHLLRKDYREATEATRRAGQEFSLAGYPFNRVWAALQEARICLEQYDKVGYEELMHWVRPMVGQNAPPVTQVEFRVVEVKARYLFRAPIDETCGLATDTFATMSADGGMLLRLELVQLLFRLFARRGATKEAGEMFEQYRALVSEVLSNVEGGKAAEVAQWFSLKEMLDECSILEAQKRKGSHKGSLFLGQLGPDGFSPGRRH